MYSRQVFSRNRTGGQGDEGYEVKGAGSEGRGAMRGVRGTGVVGAGSGGRGCGKRGKTRPFLAENVFCRTIFWADYIYIFFFFTAAQDFLIR